MIKTILFASVVIIAAGLVLPDENKTFGIVKNAFAQSAGDNSSDLSGVLPDNSTDFGIPGDNTTSSTQTSSTVPEFGSIAPIILAISVISIIVISARTRIRQ